MRLAPEIEEKARGLIKFCEEQARKADEHELASELSMLDCGLAMSEIFRNRFCDLILGMGKEEWVSRTFRDRQGNPRKYSWAMRLAREASTIRCFPGLEALLRKGKPQTGTQVVTFSSCYWAAETAIFHSWLDKEIEARLKGLRDFTDEAIASAKELAFDDVQRRVIQLAMGKSACELRDELQVVKAELRGRGLDTKPDPSDTWETVTWVMPASVKSELDSLLSRILKLEDEPPTKALTGTQAAERLVLFARDMLDALEQATNGNTGPLHSLLESIARKVPADGVLRTP
jgi:hypothetical protein